MEAHKFTLPITTEGDLRDFVRCAFGAGIPSRVVVDGHATPWMAFCDSYFAKNRVSVWKASRGFGGKSYLLALLSLTEALTLKADVKVLGGSGAQSKNVQDYISVGFYSYSNCPRQIWDGEPLTTVSRFQWGNTIQALPASQKSVRGPHPQRLRLDEVDEMDLAIFDAAMGQAMSKVEDGKVTIPAQTTISSTHQYPDGTMTEILKRARHKGWPIYEWGYQETSADGGWLLRSEVEAKRADVTAVMWDVEYDLQEPSSENRAILPQSVEGMFDEARGKFIGKPGEYIETEKPRSGQRYGTGADWARKRDWTVIVTLLKASRAELVAFERRNREPWPKVIARFDKRVGKFGGNAAHDATGVGDVIDGYLKHRAIPVVMVGNQRKILFTDYIAAIEDNAIVSPMIEFMYNEHRYCSYDDLYGSGHPPDSIVGGAMAWRALRGGGWVWKG